MDLSGGDRPLWTTPEGLDVLPARGGLPSESPVGAATTQLTPRVLWTPGDARQYADDVNGQWVAQEAAIASCSKPFALFAEWIQDYTSWSSFYANSSDWHLWWNSGEIDSWNDTANAWRAKVASACGEAGLPPGGPSDALAALDKVQTFVTWAAVVGGVGAVVWFAWPWLSGLRGSGAPRRKKNPGTGAVRRRRLAKAKGKGKRAAW